MPQILIRYPVVLLLLLLVLLLAGCGQKSSQVDPKGDRVDVVTLPKFGLDPHWGGREIPTEIRQQREALLQGLAERKAEPNDFALEVTETGWNAMAEADFNTAMRRFNQAWLVQPQTPYAIMGMAMVVFERDGDVKGGLMLMQSLEQPLAEDGFYWINRASMKKRSGMHSEALEDFQRAARIAPDNTIVVKSLAELFHVTQNYPAACAMLTKARGMNVDMDAQIARSIEQKSSSSCSPA